MRFVKLLVLIKQRFPTFWQMVLGTLVTAGVLYCVGRSAVAMASRNVHTHFVVSHRMIYHFPTPWKKATIFWREGSATTFLTTCNSSASLRKGDKVWIYYFVPGFLAQRNWNERGVYESLFYLRLELKKEKIIVSIAVLLFVLSRSLEIGSTFSRARFLYAKKHIRCWGFVFLIWRWVVFAMATFIS